MRWLKNSNLIINKLIINNLIINNLVTTNLILITTKNYFRIKILLISR